MVSRVSTYDWLLFLHLLGAVAAVAALVTFAASLVGALRSERPSQAAAFLQLARPGGVLSDVGGTLLIVFGIWLAFEADYGITDEWVVAAIVFWVVAAYAATRTRVRLLAARDRAVELAREGDAASAELRPFVRAGRAPALYAVTLVSVLAMLVLMIFKPGAG